MALMPNLGECKIYKSCQYKHLLLKSYKDHVTRFFDSAIMNGEGTIGFIRAIFCTSSQFIGVRVQLLNTQPRKRMDLKREEKPIAISFDSSLSDRFEIWDVASISRKCAVYFDNDIPKAIAVLPNLVESF